MNVFYNPVERNLKFIKNDIRLSIPVLTISSHLCKTDRNSSAENHSCNWPTHELKSPIKHIYLLSLDKEMNSLSISKKQSEDAYPLPSEGK